MGQTNYSTETLIEIYSARKYGSPKLIKPKELSGIKMAFSIYNICSCKCFIYNNDCYINHRDFFSECISREQFKDRYNDVLATKPKRFIYNDGENKSVTLRNEAWLKLPDIISYLYNATSNTISLIVHNIIRQLEQLLGWEQYSIDLEWDRFFEEVLVAIQKYRKE